jgi:serine/threonine-protein phosphatase 6 catalytic subunit
VNSLTLIARAHQLVQEGYKHMFDEQLVTVWSAPNYCYRCGNMASILTFRDNGERSFTVYGAAPENDRDTGMKVRKMVSESAGKISPVQSFLHRIPLCHILCNLSLYS